MGLCWFRPGQCTGDHAPSGQDAAVTCESRGKVTCRSHDLVTCKSHDLVTCRSHDIVTIWYDHTSVLCRATANTTCSPPQEAKISSTCMRTLIFLVKPAPKAPSVQTKAQETTDGSKEGEKENDEAAQEGEEGAEVSILFATCESVSIDKLNTIFPPPTGGR